MNVLLIGGSGLIGSAIVQKFENRKINYLNFDRFKKHKNFFKGNLEKIEDLKKLTKFYHNKFGKINCVINCSYPSKIKTNDIKIENSKWLINYKKNFLSYLQITVFFIKYFRKHKIEGNIINFASIYGDSLPKFDIYKKNILTPLDYNFVKNNIINMSKYFAKKYLGSRIRINAISPGGVFDNHEKNFVKRYAKYTNYKSMLDPLEVAELTFFLSSEKSKKITGQNFIIDDGFTL